MKSYAVLYDYPTTDRYYRGQRGVRVRATSEQAAIRMIRTREVGGYGPVPDAKIVRISERVA